MAEVQRLAAELDRLLDELLVNTETRADRRKGLEDYVDAMSAAQRLRLAGALHLLSRRLDEELAHPDSRASVRAA